MRKTKAFTLIELLIVIVIIGILAVAVYLTVSGTRKKAGDANAKNSVSEVQKAVEAFISDTDANDPGSVIMGGETTALKPISSVINNLKIGNRNLLTSVPKDAKGGEIEISASGSSYKIRAEAFDSVNFSKCWTAGSSDWVPNPTVSQKEPGDCNI